MQHGDTGCAVGVGSVPLVTDTRQLPRYLAARTADRQRVDSATLPRATVAGNRRIRAAHYCTQHTSIATCL